MESRTTTSKRTRGPAAINSASATSQTNSGTSSKRSWHLYVVRTVNGALYAGVTTDVMRRYREHAAGGPKAAKFLRANPPSELVFTRRIGSRALALKVEYWFKRLSRHRKEAIVKSGRLRFDRVSGTITWPK